MKNVNIEQSPIGKKLAAATLTKAIRGKFQLYPAAQAKGILEMCKQEGLDPLEAVMFLGAILPGMVVEFLAETQRIIESQTPKKKGKSVPAWSAILKRYQERLIEHGGYTENPLMQNVTHEFGIDCWYYTSNQNNASKDSVVPEDSPLTKGKKIGEVVEHNGQKLVVIYCDNEEIHVIPKHHLFKIPCAARRREQEQKASGLLCVYFKEMMLEYRVTIDPPSTPFHAMHFSHPPIPYS